MKQQYLITGGCGFIGLALIRKLVEFFPETSIRVVDNLSVGKLQDLENVCSFTEQKIDDLSLNRGVSFVEGDIRDLAVAKRIATGIDTIIHLAANSGVPYSIENPCFDMENNVLGTFNVLEAARLNNVKTLVFASSSAIAGNVEPPMHENMIARPISPYGASKLAGEGYCSVYAHSYGIKTVILRFGNVYGPCPLHKTSVVAKFIKKALNGEPSIIYGDGSQTRDFIFIEDLLDAVLKAANFEKGGEVFQIATSKERTVGEMADLLAKALEKYGVSMKIKNGERRKGDVVRNFSDTSKALKLLGWKATTELEEGLEKTAGYFCIARNMSTCS